eukprot:CAMPEP_0117437848 /NCGR_PEP_ID=MMETSP0759-20121206/1743_1 /TAXON_ID=63605 /ORGANISM="Percolomonas cosmopolitus, Strain WS" /LENGTH=517 /DNA_ID=CAMNT_0005229509 /DNA_START=513 /DNA_END=2066 /DNA_ORIENTATION=+
MEQFKTVEKESKMKAYSKEALAKKTRDTKRKKLDKRGQRNVGKIEKWIDTLQEQVDESEDALQDIQDSKRPDPEEVERLEDIVKKHRIYIDKLTETMRLLRKGTIESDDVEQISDDIEYYIEDHQDPDFYENELLFDTIMEKKEGTYEDDDEDTNELLEIPEVDEDTVQESVDIPVQPVLRINDIIPKADESPKEEEEEPQEPPKKPKKEKKDKKDKSSKKSSTSSTSSSSSKNLTPTPQATVAQQPAVSYRDIIASADDNNNKTPPAVESGNEKKIAASVVSSTDAAAASSPTTGHQISGPSPTIVTVPAAQKQQSTASPIPTNVYAPNATPPSVATSNVFQQQNQTPTSQTLPPQQQQQQQQAPKQFVKLSRSARVDDQLMKSMLTMPTDVDTEAPNAYKPRNPVDTPDFFPQARHPKFNSPEFFAKFETADPLFFAFYFQQGQYQQELAARELKNKQWRFLAPKYMAWFKRHAPPTETTEKFERGTYVYFDYDAAWTPRVKQNFTFTYADVLNG